MSKESRLDRGKKTITRTFRIRKGWDDVLQEEAARHCMKCVPACIEDAITVKKD